MINIYHTFVILDSACNYHSFLHAQYKKDDVWFFRINILKLSLIILLANLDFLKHQKNIKIYQVLLLVIVTIYYSTEGKTRLME